MPISTPTAYVSKKEERKRQRSKHQNQEAGRGAEGQQIIALWEMKERDENISKSKDE